MVPYLSVLIKLKFMIWYFQVAFSPRSNQLWTNLERIPISTFASFHLKPWLVHFCNIYMLSLTSCCFASHSMTGKKMIINCLHLLKFETINYISKKMVFFFISVFKKSLNSIVILKELNQNSLFGWKFRWFWWKTLYTNIFKQMSWPKYFLTHHSFRFFFF